MYQLEGRVLRAAPYVLNGNSTFVFDVRVTASEGGVPCDEVSRVSIHSSLVESRQGMATLALLQPGDRVKVRLEADMKKSPDENYISCDHLLEVQVTYRE